MKQYVRNYLNECNFLFYPENLPFMEYFGRELDIAYQPRLFGSFVPSCVQNLENTSGR